jgi:Mrp family chromosome partitioning ATPase
MTKEVIEKLPEVTEAKWNIVTKAKELNAIDRILAVMSGKGSGKSLVSSLVAIALRRQGTR